MDIFTQLDLRSKNREGIALVCKRDGIVYDISYPQLINLVGAFCLSLQKMKFKKGDSFGIMLPNCAEWIIADLAVLKLGGKVVPIPKNITRETLKFILKNSKTKILLADKRSAPVPKTGKLKVIDIGDFGDYLKERPGRKDLKKVKIGEKDPATICYTSGSTGLPKGVILSHKNILSNVFSQPFSLSEKDSLISYLPLSHMFERTCGYYAPLMNGAKIVLCENHDKLLDYAKEFQPTILLTIPRVIEKINRKIDEGVVSKSLSRAPLLQKVVGAKLKAKIGGNLRFMVSGAAPLGKELAGRFWGMGIKIYEGYGLTECSPVVTTNHETDCRMGSVGKPIKGVKIKIKRGKIFIKSPGLMLGYTQKAKTKKRIKNGWFNTGDLGHKDKDGFLYIDGRADTWIVMNSGKKAFPEPIEKLLNKVKGVEQSFVFGKNKPYLTAILCGKEKEKDLQERIDRVNEKLLPHEAVKKFLFITEPFSIENGLLTHTFKLRREKIYDKYKKEIEKLYKKRP